MLNNFIEEKNPLIVPEFYLYHTTRVLHFKISINFYKKLYPLISYYCENNRATHINNNEF